MSFKKSAFGVPAPLPKFKRVVSSTIKTGEDLPALKRIAKEIKGQNITVEDFILLVGPHTGDKGAALTKVMNEDLTYFRKMVTKVYDTMTKDASDVMANTQIELGQLYAEKQRQLVDSMLRSLQIIKDYVPDFDFQLYFKDPDKYLSSLFKLTDLPDEEEVEAARRQLAYHRLQWLQSEGERLQAENMKLEERLTELKQVKRKQITEALTKEQEAETKRIELEQKQEEMQSELEILSDELHEAIISEEIKSMNTKKEKALKILAKKLKPGSIGDVKSRLRQPDWNVKVASEYSKAQIQGEAAVSRPITAPSETDARCKTRGMKRRPKKPVPIQTRPDWQDVNIDEFCDGGRPAAADDVPIDILSVGTSLGAKSSAPTCGASRTTRAPPPSYQPGRRYAGPQDTWGGYK